MVSIGSNISSLNAQRRLGEHTDALSKSFERLASGQRINHGSDDAAGLAISATLNSNSRVYGQAVRNVNDGISLVNIAQGALSQLTEILTRQKELSEQSLNGTYSFQQRGALDKESDALTKEYNRIVESTALNGVYLVDGNLAKKGLRIQAGFGDNGSLNILLGNEMGRDAGTGTFSGTTNLASASIIDEATGDFNGDGFQDLATINNSSGELVIRLNNGSGQFSASQTISGLLGLAVESADLNGDGNLDIVTRGSVTSMVSYLGNGNGTFQSARTADSGFSQGVGHGFSTFILSDLNGDGKVDLAHAEETSANLLVALGDGQGSFGAFTSFATGLSDVYSIASGDVNGDGIEDIVAANFLQSFRVMLGNGDGKFHQGLASTISANQGISDISITDLDNDGKGEIVVSEINSHATTFFKETSGAYTRSSFTTTGGNRGAGLLIGDFNDDGYQDIGNADWDTGRSYIFFNNQHGSFSGEVSIAGGNPIEYSGAEVGDFDGNGTLDIVRGKLAAISFNVSDTTRKVNKIDSLDLLGKYGAKEAMIYLDKKLEAIGRELGSIGAFQSRLSVASSNISTMKLQSEAANSRIIDVDVAQESANLVKTQILQQVSASVLAQANQSPSLALKLLNG